MSASQAPSADPRGLCAPPGLLSVWLWLRVRVSGGEWLLCWRPAVWQILRVSRRRGDLEKIETSVLKCSLQQVSEHFCPDGLVFDETSTSYAKCGFPFSIDCTGGAIEHVDNNSWCNIYLYLSGREDLQPAQPSPGCPRQEGYFSYPDEKVRKKEEGYFIFEISCLQVCNKFNFCTRGVPNSITCAGGLIFDPLLGQCDYSDQVNRLDKTIIDIWLIWCV